MKEKMEASTSKEYGDFAKSLEDELMKYTTNYEEQSVGTYYVERTEKMHMNSDNEVNLVEAEHSHTTECSSSFNGSDCGDEGVDNLSEAEVFSDFCGGAESAPLDFHGSGNLFTKRKKISSHWRSFIHPLMWRCKWVELQIKKLEAQARKYDRKLEVYSQRNLVQLAKSTFEGHGMNPLTFYENNVRSEVVQRKRRRRNEATNDVAAYTAHHNLFSYYEHRKYISEISHNVLKNPDTRTCEEAKADVELDNDEAGDCDKHLEDILRKIDIVHLRALNLKSRVDEVMVEQAARLCSTDYLSSPPTPPYRTPVGSYIASQLMAEYNLGAVLLPSHGDANEHKDHPHFAYGYENEDDDDDDDDDVLIDNHRVIDELRYFEDVKIHSMKGPWVLKDALDGSTSHPEPQPRLQTRSTSNLTNAPQTKRRKAS